jgi:hypothetical protein
MTRIVVTRLQYECRSGYDAGTDGSRPASGLRYLPRLNFRGALTALRNRISARVQLRQKTTRGLFDRFQFSPFARVFHEGNSSDGVCACPTPSRANPT